MNPISLEQGDWVPAGAVLLVATSDDTSEVRFMVSSDREVTEAPPMDAVEGLGITPAFDRPPEAAVAEARAGGTRPHIRSLFADSIGPFDPSPIQPRHPAKSDASKYRRSQSEAPTAGTPKLVANPLPPWRSQATTASTLSWMPSVTEGVPFSVMVPHGIVSQTPRAGPRESDEVPSSPGDGAEGGAAVDARGDSRTGTHEDPGDQYGSGAGGEGTSVGGAPSLRSSRSPEGPSQGIPGARPAATTPNRLQLLFADVEPAGQDPRDTVPGVRPQQQAAADQLPSRGSTTSPQGPGEPRSDGLSPTNGSSRDGPHIPAAGSRQIRWEDLAEPLSMAEPVSMAEAASTAEPATMAEASSSLGASMAEAPSSLGASAVAPNLGVEGAAPAVPALGILVPTVLQASQSTAQGYEGSEVEPRGVEADGPPPGTVNRLARLFVRVPGEADKVGYADLSWEIIKLNVVQSCAHVIKFANRQICVETL